MSTKTARRLEDLPDRFNAASDLLEHNLAAGRGDKVAFIDHRGSTTYDQLVKRVDLMAGAFGDIGVGRDQRVLLCLLDTIDFPVAFLAAIKVGVVPVPLNTLLTTDDYRWILENSGASAVIVSRDCAAAWTSIAADHPRVRFVSSDGGPWTAMDALIDAAAPATRAADTHRDDVAFWLYTSGSTGRPKGAMHVQGSLRLTANLFGTGVIDVREEDVVFSVAKLFFAYGLGNGLTFPLASGATTILLKDRATPLVVDALLETHRVSVLCGVPTFFANWIASDATPGHRPSSLRIATSAGESLPAHLGEAVTARFGMDVIDGLGSTEMLHVYLAQSPGQVRYGCTGRAVPGYELRIIGENGAPVPAGESGELQIRGPTAAIGYWRNRAKSKTTFVGEWTRSGDIYRCDADGWYSYLGRRDDMLKVSGIYVSPTEVEEILTRHPEVLEAAVVGQADDQGLVKPCAYVVLASGLAPAPTLEDELKAYVKQGLAPHKYPRWIRFVDALPKTATGKIQRYQLRNPS